MTIKNALKENEKKGLKTKLRLSKETIRVLKNFELKQVAGGAYTYFCATNGRSLCRSLCQDC